MASKNVFLGSLETEHWDVTPFITAPVIQDSANGWYRIITIPNSPYPSPLIEDITPHSLKTLHDTLTSGNSARGVEVWKAWKRAWDLWNNHYIKGRANPLWIQEELRRRKEERRKYKKARPKHVIFTPKNVPEVHDVFDGQKEELVIPPKGRKWVRGRDSARVLIQEDVFGDVHQLVSASVPRWELVDDLDNPVLPQDEESEKYKMEEDEWIHNLGDEVVGNDQDGIIEGWSGGFLALKHFQGNEELGLDDSVANTVWRPIWVGEEDSGEGCALLDELWEEQKTRRAGGGEKHRDPGLLEIDGGVDAGGGPFACLRWMYKYVRRGEGGNAAYRKRKVWDEVTGTIFNMPMVPYNKSARKGGPLPSPREPELNNHFKISRLLNLSSLSTPKKDYERNNIFPLDIRRLQFVTVSETDRNGHGPQLILEGETLVTTSYNNPNRTFRSTLNDSTDPWYVTEEQEGHRDVPIRHWPLYPNNESSDILPYDETHYLTHRMRDRLGEAGYFVTNLFGGTLLINGQAIGKGQMAGPLPKFAVIETPGGQVSFWWGENGRGYGEEGIRVSDVHWETLRRNRGWELVGKSAGEVWDERIIDRLKREEKGEEGEDDDDEWKFYRNWRQREDVEDWGGNEVDTVRNLTEGKDYFAEPQVVKIFVPKRNNNDEHDSYKPDTSNLIFAPQQFASAEQELKYLAIENTLIEAAVNIQIEQPVIPARKETWWQGPVEMAHCENQERVRQVTVDEMWKAWRDTFINRQEALCAQVVSLTQSEKSLILQKEVKARELYEEQKKRKAEGDGDQPLKRPYDHAVSLLQKQNEVAVASVLLQGITAQRRKDAKRLRSLQIKIKRERLKKEYQAAELKKNNRFTPDVASKVSMNWIVQEEVDKKKLTNEDPTESSENMTGTRAALNETAIREAIKQNAEAKKAQHDNLIRILKSLNVTEISIAKIMSLLEEPLHGSSDWSQVQDLSEDDIALYRGLFDSIGELRLSAFNMQTENTSSQFKRKFAQYTSDLLKLASPNILPAELEAQRKADLEAAMEAQATVDGITPSEMYMKKGYRDFEKWYAGVDKEDQKFFSPQRENRDNYSGAKKQANSDIIFYTREQARRGLKIRADYEYHGDQAACLNERYNCKTEDEYLQQCAGKLEVLEGMPPELEKPTRKEEILTRGGNAAYKAEMAIFEKARKLRGLLHKAEMDRYDHNTRIISEEIRDSEAAYLASCQPLTTRTEEDVFSRDV